MRALDSGRPARKLTVGDMIYLAGAGARPFAGAAGVTQEKDNSRALIADSGTHTTRGTAFFLVSAPERLSAPGFRPPSPGAW